MNPFAENPLATRADLQKAVADLFTPLQAHFSPGAARLRLGFSGAHYDEHVAELEAFARPLWGIVPLVAGGGSFSQWEIYQRGLANGTNPEHAEYWGAPRDFDQRLVEMAAISLALMLVPEKVWEPLAADAKTHLATWLGAINTCAMPDCNWLWFRILTNLGLANVDAEHDQAIVEKDLDRLDEFYLGDGWYSDGPVPQRDYYIPFAMHFYGLIYAKFAGERDPERAQQYRERAAQFAQDFVYWFDAEGAALPFGRSQTYRFAQGAFWGGLAFADVEALPWGVVKGLALRHLRWWAQQPIFSSDGILSIGYAYPNLNMAEQYNAPGSPYWAMKFFLPLALPENHPFWQAEEAPLPPLEPIKQQDHPYMIFYRDQESRHAVALTSGQHQDWMRHGSEKYAKFAYSTAFAFSVPMGRWGLAQAAADSMLALSDDGEHYRVRIKTSETAFAQGALYSRWHPFADVDIETWLIPHPPWHIRVHRIRSKRKLWSAEGGFALDRTGDNVLANAGTEISEPGFATAQYPAGGSGIRDLRAERKGQVVRAEPNTNLLAPRTVLPTLVEEHEPGEYWLTCAVLAEPEGEQWSRDWEQEPTLPAFLAQRIQSANN